MSTLPLEALPALPPPPLLQVTPSTGRIAAPAWCGSDGQEGPWPCCGAAWMDRECSLQSSSSPSHPGAVCGSTRSPQEIPVPHPQLPGTARRVCPAQAQTQVPRSPRASRGSQTMSTAVCCFLLPNGRAARTARPAVPSAKPCLCPCLHRRGP